jgi:hypothetical protein
MKKLTSISYQLWRTGLAYDQQRDQGEVAWMHQQSIIDGLRAEITRLKVQNRNNLEYVIQETQALL